MCFNEHNHILIFLLLCVQDGYLLTNCKFLQVIATFCFFLLWYAFFIVAFGLGFYILLHKKPEDKPEDGIENTNENDKTSDVKVVCAKEDGYAFFNSPWLSLIKTSTMFVGELVIMMYLITSFESFERLILYFT
jgi:hypothetical protein